jgi:glucose-6-phosphate 1-dehydrogenase
MRVKEKPDDCILVIFGASGDLSRRKLVPALYDLCRTRELPPQLAVLGVSRTPMTDGEFRGRAKTWCQEAPGFTGETWERFERRLHYQSADATKEDGFSALVDRLDVIRRETEIGENLLFYLSVAPQLYEPILSNIGDSGLVTEGQRWCSLNRDEAPWQRVVIEKPFGYDLESAAHLNRVLGRVFEEENTYRIDHYLGKETVQNLLVFRFANSIWEPLWSRQYIDHVQITAAETVGLEDRGGYYEGTGALRDMIQSHLLQLMAVLAMEPPNSYSAPDLRNEQRKVLEAVAPIPQDSIREFAVRGQYGRGTGSNGTQPAYREESGVDPDSSTETFAALKLFVNNWRWQGVPFLLRTGKRMRRKLTQMVIHFRPAPHPIFADDSGRLTSRPPNRLIVNVQPDEGISLRFEGKVPGQGLHLQSAVMDFDYAEQFGGEAPDAYATLLLDAMSGDRSLFKDRFEIEAAWRIVAPVLDAWAESEADFPNYESGSWGPEESERLLAGHGTWRNPEGAVSRSKMIAE